MTRAIAPLPAKVFGARLKAIFGAGVTKSHGVMSLRGYRLVNPQADTETDVPGVSGRILRGPAA